MGNLPGKYIPKHVGLLIGRSILTTASAVSANRLCFFIGNKGNGGKAQRQEGGKKAPFVDEYLSHLAWFIGFDEGRNPDVTGMVKNIFEW